MAKNAVNNSIVLESEALAQVNRKISLLELLNIFEEHRHSIIVNLKQLQENYQRQGIKRVRGSRDENGNLVKPVLTTEEIDQGAYVNMGTFAMNRNTATINMLIYRKVQLVKAEEQTSVGEVAGLLLNDLATFNNYTIVSEGKVNVKSLQVKISRKKVFDLLQEKGVLEKEGYPAQEFDFRTVYTIRLDNLPLALWKEEYSRIDGLFFELAQIKVLTSIISAQLKQESEILVRGQVEELKEHYLSKSLYLNFPTTNEYSDINEALATGTLDSRVSYQIDIGTKDILNFSKLYSANKFLKRMYEAYDLETGTVFSQPTVPMALDSHIAFRHKQLSSRMKITKVDEFMKPIFDDFLGLEKNRVIEAILRKVGDEMGLQLFQKKWSGEAVSKDETVAVLTATKMKLEEYIERIFQDKIRDLVFFIGSTGRLPDNIKATVMNYEELAKKYTHLQFSKKEQKGTFFEVGESIISVYPKNRYYNR